LNTVELQTEERRYLVTGGSRGLGLRFCRHYLEGTTNRVVSCARRATEDARQLEREAGGRFTFLELDLLEPAAAGQLVGAAVEVMGGVDVLVNNAGAGQDSLLAHTRDDEISAIVNLNLTATIRVIRQVIRRMILDGGGKILNVSSIAAVRGYPGLTVYSATKGGLEALTRTLACELGEAGIAVNAVAPGFFESEMSSVLAPRQIETIRRRTPTGALATLEQVVRACDPLIARDANITGHILVVDGGAVVA
jgi:3-oxoacyl-[acyl-carrier protein] reductase